MFWGFRGANETRIESTNMNNHWKVRSPTGYCPVKVAPQSPSREPPTISMPLVMGSHGNAGATLMNKHLLVPFVPSRYLHQGLQLAPLDPICEYPARTRSAH